MGTDEKHEAKTSSGLQENAADKESAEMKMRDAPEGLVEPNGFDARLQAQLGHKLKAMFDEVAKAPVPDKFLELLSQLEGRASEK